MDFTNLYAKVKKIESLLKDIQECKNIIQSSTYNRTEKERIDNVAPIIDHIYASNEIDVISSISMNHVKGYSAEDNQDALNLLETLEGAIAEYTKGLPNFIVVDEYEYDTDANDTVHNAVSITFNYQRFSVKTVVVYCEGDASPYNEGTTTINGREIACGEIFNKIILDLIIYSPDDIYSFANNDTGKEINEAIINMKKYEGKLSALEL